MEEMFPRKILEDYDADANRPSAWLTKAKLAVQGDKRVEPFIFKAEVRRFSCPSLLAPALRKTKLS